MGEQIQPCPCGSGRPLADCCGRFHVGGVPPDAESLMRSRYAAYALGLYDYLYATWHASTRPAEGELGGTSLRWIVLEIVSCQAGGVGDEDGMVEFIASFVDRGKGRRLFERSRFVREQGSWLYVDGECRLQDIGRNEPCPCGSGRKFKQCCLALT